MERSPQAMQRHVSLRDAKSATEFGCTGKHDEVSTASVESLRKFEFKQRNFFENIEDSGGHQGRLR